MITSPRLSERLHFFALGPGDWSFAVNSERIKQVRLLKTAA
ncbi:MAG TPA: hypothetical protein VFB27_12810 [Opitutaceae bacterium]|nr:hypothetical protein [Opitutaceae bacterium]